ncbi:MAG: DUF4190 domain-containing protein [Planctomycetota bacterium]|jgi:prepilin-type processing-associated H-X9-DG protein
MHCPKCGKENPDDAQICQSCSALLTQAPLTAERPIVKTSGLAIAALVLGILSVFTCGITAIPVVILGIISLVQIGKSGGRLTGRGFAVVGIVVPVGVFFLMMGILMPALNRTRQISFRIVCGTNLSGMGKAMLLYANDFDDEFPRAGRRNSTWWPEIRNWQANYRWDAFGINRFDDSGGQASISTSLYLLVKYMEMGPKQFICKGDSGTTEFRPDKYGVRDKDLLDLWDFGPNPSKHCSYSYHMPYGPYALTTSNPRGMAVAADRNPWIDTYALKARDFYLFKWDGNIKQQKAGNTFTHQGEGQNVLFVDGHATLEMRSFCGINDDNIYTYWDGEDIHRGAAPVLGSQPADRLDSLLVHDPPLTGRK